MWGGGVTVWENSVMGVRASDFTSLSQPPERFRARYLSTCMPPQNEHITCYLSDFWF